ncbi:MAG: C-terminal binding protein [Planctomycetota bacterium]
MKAVIIDLGYADYEPEKAAAKSAGAELVLAGCKSQAEVLEACRDADAIAVRQSVIDRRAIDAMTRCRIIARYGIGVDNVDLKAAGEKGIYATNVTTYCLDEVAEQALALLLAAARKVILHDRFLRQGKWDMGPSEKLYRIQGRTLGLVGLGQIPRRLVKKVRGFSFRILAYDPYVSEEEMKKLGVGKADLETVLGESDYVSLHAAVTPETTDLMNEARLRLMKPTAILVNTSRGALVDEAALAKVLREKRIACACLDVYKTEPLEKDSPLRGLENCILTDHCAWYSEESIIDLQQAVADQMAIALKGGEPPSVVNRKYLKRKA